MTGIPLLLYDHSLLPAADCDAAAGVQVVVAESLVVLSHHLPHLLFLRVTRQNQHIDGYLGGFGEEILQTAQGPTEGHLLGSLGLGLQVVNHHLDHPCSFFDLGSLDFLLYLFLDL